MNNSSKQQHGNPNIKNNFKNGNKIIDKKTNISNYKNNFNQILKEINNDEKTKQENRNRFFSPVISSRTSTNFQNSFKFKNDSLNTSENLLHKKMFNNNLNQNNIFSYNYKIKKGQKEKRIEEDIKSNYYFELKNFDKIQKIRDVMKNIFLPNFIENIFGDDIISVISSINKIKNYLEKENKNNVLKIEEISDILLKVLGYKLTINKSKSLIIETLEFINTLLESYKQNKLFLTEIESNILLNIFVDALIY